MMKNQEAAMETQTVAGHSKHTAPRGWKRLAIGLVSAAMLAGGVSAGLTPTVSAAGPAAFSYANSTFTVAPAADLANQDTWVAADGTSAYTATLIARDQNNAVMTDLDTRTIVFSATGTDITISPVVSHGDGRYTATYSSKTAQSDSTASVAYRGGTSQGPTCAITPQLTELIPVLPAILLNDQPTRTKVIDGEGQLITIQSLFWPEHGYTSADQMPVTMKGTGEPGTLVTVAAPGNAYQCSATVDATGNWSCLMPLAAFPLPRLHFLWQNINTGELEPGNETSAWQTFTTSSDCGLSSEALIGSGWTTPLAINLSGGDTVETVSAAQAPGTFAFGPNGEQLHSGWLAPTSGFLVRDLNKNGLVDNVNELFGGGVGDGYAALAAYDSNGDKVIDDKDEHYDDLQVWIDKNMNKVTDPGELLLIRYQGIVSISLAHTDTWEADAAGNAAYEHGTAMLVHNRPTVVHDVYFAISVSDARPIPFKVGRGPLSPVTSTFAIDPVADPYNRSTWVDADGVSAYTLTLTARDDDGNLLPDLDVWDIDFRDSDGRARVSGVINQGDGRYTTTVTATDLIMSAWAQVRYKDEPIGTPGLTLFM